MRSKAVLWASPGDFKERKEFKEEEKEVLWAIVDGCQHDFSKGSRPHDLHK